MSTLQTHEVVDHSRADGGTLRAFGLWLLRLKIAAAAQRGGRRRDGMVGGALAEAADARVPHATKAMSMTGPSKEPTETCLSTLSLRL